MAIRISRRESHGPFIKEKPGLRHSHWHHRNEGNLESRRGNGVINFPITRRWISSLGVAVDKEQVARIEIDCPFDSRGKIHGLVPERPKVRPVRLKSDLTSELPPQNPREVTKKHLVRRPIGDESKPQISHSLRHDGQKHLEVVSVLHAATSRRLSGHGRRHLLFRWLGEGKRVEIGTKRAARHNLNVRPCFVTPRIVKPPEGHGLKAIVSNNDFLPLRYQQIIILDQSDNGRRMGVDDHLPQRILVTDRLRRIDTEIPEDRQH